MKIETSLEKEEIHWDNPPSPPPEIPLPLNHPTPGISIPFRWGGGYGYFLELRNSEKC